MSRILGFNCEYQWGLCRKNNIVKSVQHHYIQELTSATSEPPEYQRTTFAYEDSLGGGQLRSKEQTTVCQALIPNAIAVTKHPMNAQKTGGHINS